MGITNENPTKTMVIPYLIISMGVLCFFDAISFYKQNKKIIASVMLLISLFIIVIGIIGFLKFRD